MNDAVCYKRAAKDGSEALVTYVQVLAEANVKSRKIRLKGLDAGADYRLEETGNIYGGVSGMGAVAGDGKIVFIPAAPGYGKSMA